MSTSFLKAQGNLQFNQVKWVFAQETVPVGKVWKIESIMYSASVGSVSNSLTQDDQIKIDGSPYTVRSARSGNGGYNAASYFVWEQRFPMWLYAGQTLQAWVNVGRINVIEFNIVP
ncbi:MAG: hypothetical protein FJZ80_04330 [Bacteroidetes bacterium]|nr:hypothetical protein [Bacteroidota bacterium]